MSLVNLAHACSHLTHASKARLTMTSIPSSNLHLRLALALKEQGFISSVVRGGPNPPPMHPLLNIPVSGNETGDVAPVTQQNVASRRIWLGLKYWKSAPVMSKLKLESKPTRRIWLDVDQIRDIVRGTNAGYINGLRSPGECLFFTTDRGVLEARQCVERKVGGMVLCRVV